MIILNLHALDLHHPLLLQVMAQPKELDQLQVAVLQLQDLLQPRQVQALTQVQAQEQVQEQVQAQAQIQIQVRPVEAVSQIATYQNTGIIAQISAKTAQVEQIMI